MHIAILGAGAWGTALAVSAAARHVVTLWARDPVQAERMQTHRENRRYLPTVALPANLRVTARWQDAVAGVHQGPAPALTLVATPMVALEPLLRELPRSQAVMWLCKGFQADTARLGHEIAAALRTPADAPCGVLSGPSFAQEVARGLPSALVAASRDAALAAQAVSAFHCESLRVYTGTDPVGVEVGGAVKNVMAIATGICDGLGMGHNARAALVTRGLAEMTRLGVALGAQAETFMGLSGLGDLVLTATGDLSRNRQVGLQLAQGRALPEILSQLGHVAEGVYSAATVQRRARCAQVDTPIVDAVVAVLEGRLSAPHALQVLMRRDARPEH